MRAVLLLALFGCRSPATHFYTLVPPSPIASAAPSSPTLQLEILPVDVPADVDRAELVVRRSATEVAAVDGRSWIAPLPQEIHRALADALVRALHARDLGDAAGDPALPTYRVKLVVKRFESALGDAAAIDATWTVRGPKSPAPLACEAAAREATPARDYEALVTAHQHALAQLADDVAATVRAVEADPAHASCPSGPSGPSAPSGPGAASAGAPAPAPSHSARGS